MKVYLYNTMGRQKEEFIPIEKGKVGMYTCGLTVYDYAHIGNLRMYIFEDVLKKSLEYAGYKVKHVMNITDVGHLQSDSDEGEDKLEIGAKRENKTPLEIARFYENAFLEDFKRLNIKMPTVCCRATEHIEDMIDLIKILEKKGFTYISNGNVYFEIDKFKDYYKLANLSMDELQAGSRVEVDVNKKNPLDFVLWFTNSKYTNHIMKWDSPWGTGFPGWHVECSAMSMKYLGERMDIHCGGVDHIPVHHTNEIAQSEGAIGHKWVNYWVHGEFLVLNGAKMSKSNGNFLTISKLIEQGYSPMDYRYFCLQSRYRKQLAFSFESLKDAKNALYKLKNKISLINNEVNDSEFVDKNKMNIYREKFSKQICDDLNIPNAITVLNDVIKDSELNSTEKIELVKDFDKVLSLDLLKKGSQKVKDKDEILINKLIDERNQCRKNKDWTRADEIRNLLLDMNIEIIDSKEGTKWKLR